MKDKRQRITMSPWNYAMTDPSAIYAYIMRTAALSTAYPPFVPAMTPTNAVFNPTPFRPDIYSSFQTNLNPFLPMGIPSFPTNSIYNPHIGVSPVSQPMLDIFGKHVPTPPAGQVPVLCNASVLGDVTSVGPSSNASLRRMTSQTGAHASNTSPNSELYSTPLFQPYRSEAKNWPGACSIRNKM